MTPSRGVRAGRLIALSTLARLGLAAVLPMGHDEAYYFEWGRELAAGYYDHPPLVAVLAAAGRALLGDTAPAARIFPVLLFALTSWVAHGLARRAYGDAAALRLVIAVQVVPVFTLGGVLLTPDAPHALFWVLALDRAHRAVTEQRPAEWLATGAALGGALLSKYNAGLLLPILLLYLATDRELRRWLGAWQPWAGVALALATFSPVIAWNAAHGWASFLFQLGHGLGGGGLRPLGWLQSIGAQAGYVSPIFWVLALAAAARAFARPGDAGERLFAWTSLPVIGFFTAAAGFGRSLPHWPAMGYLGALAIASKGRLPRSAYALGAVFTLAVPLQASFGLIPLPSGKDPTMEVVGWRTAAARARAELAAARAEGRTVFVFGRHWSTCGQLAFHLPEERVHCLTGDRTSAFDFFPGRRGIAGADALEVQPDDLGSGPDPECATSREITRLTAERGRAFHLRMCAGFRGAAPHGL